MACHDEFQASTNVRKPRTVGGTGGPTLTNEITEFINLNHLQVWSASFCDNPLMILTNVVHVVKGVLEGTDLPQEDSESRKSEGQEVIW